ncbi:MAG TPA: pur operon repressor [Firmicutes bacterium]|nr:pur operon repressor [Bacillota bacterium]
MRRTHRIAAITKTLVEQPGQVFALGDFADIFEVSRSTLSEDLAIIRRTFDRLAMGKIETISGAVGGVRYLPDLSEEQIGASIQDICAALRKPARIIPGGYLYTDDLLASPEVLQKIGSIFATRFRAKKPEYVVTVETAGIPVALKTAYALNVPLVIVRRQSKVSEGPVLTMNFLSSSRQVETMSLSRRALEKNSRVLLIDDFMKAGGTLRGLADLMGEFECEVVGKGVFIETGWPKEKLITDYLALIYLQAVDEEKRRVLVRPADGF